MEPYAKDSDSGENAVAFANLTYAEICTVCGDDADGYHYGAVSCRGCNAFFRRAVTNNMEFTCRRDGNCEVNKGARCACRACRLRKCEEVGMNRQAVRPPKVAAVKRKAPAKVGEKRSPSVEELDDKPESESDRTTPDESVSLVGCTEDLLLPALTPSPPATDNIIDILYFDYCDQRKRRHGMLCNTLEDLLLFASDDMQVGIPLRHATSDDLASVFKTQTILLFEWASKLPIFRQMASYDKATLLRINIFPFILLDDVFYTVEAKLTDRLLLVNDAYLATDDCGAPPISDQKLKEMLSGGWVQSLLQNCVIPWMNLRVTPQEMLACRYFMFFDIGGYHDQFSVDLSRYALQTLRLDFVSYYTKVTGSMEHMQRFGEIMSIVPHIKAAVGNLYNLATQVPEFGIVEDWRRHMNTVFAL